MSRERKEQILKELAGMTATEWNGFKIAIESNLVYLPNFYQNKEAVLEICKCKDSPKNCGEDGVTTPLQA